MASKSSDPLSSRRRALGIVVLTALVAGLLGFGAATKIRSPADVAAESQPPPASVITAPVESRVVADSMVTRGTVGALSTISAIPAHAPKGVADALITRAPVAAGSVLSPGALVVEISGQPVFFLPGRIPSYRDLKPGAVGPDVRQLQAGLGKAGLPANDPKGTYGPGTVAAVDAMYRRSGYPGNPNLGLPMSSAIFVNADKANVVVAKAKLAEPVDKAQIELASGDLIVSVQGTPAATQLLTVGASVELYSEILNQSSKATISTIKASGHEGGQLVVITPAKRLPSRWAGQDVRVTVTASSSKGKVLAVPVSALFMGGGGNPSVTLVNRTGRQSTVHVEVGATGGGYVEIKPDGVRVNAGDNVLVGER